MIIDHDTPGVRDARFFIDGVDLTDSFCVKACDPGAGWVDMYITDPRSRWVPGTPKEPGRLNIPRYVIDFENEQAATYRLHGKVEVKGLNP